MSPLEPITFAQPAQPKTRLTRQEFLDRLGGNLETILAAAKTNVRIEAWIERYRAASQAPDGTSIDLTDPRTIEGLNEMEQGGLIGQGEAARILAIE